MRHRLFGSTALALALLAPASSAAGGPPSSPPAGVAAPALGWVSGTVEDGEGKPFPGAEVRVVREKPPGAWAGQSDAKGYFAVKGVPAGPALVVVSARGRVPLRQEVKVPASGSVSVQAKLALGVRFAGKIADTEGKPVGHASILAYESSMEGGGRLRFWFSSPTGSGTSEADGTFVVDGLAPGSTYRLRVLHPHYVPVDLPGLPAEAGGGHDSLDVTVEPAAWVSGTVVDFSGSPVAGARVSGPGDEGGLGGFDRVFARLLHTSQGSGEEKDSSVTDARGHFEVGSLAPGEARLTADADAYFEGSATVDSLLAGKETSGVKISLEAATAWVEGTVVDAEGKGLAGVALDAEGDSGSAASGKTDAAGRFRLVRVRSHGPVSITARLSGYTEGAAKDVELGSKACRVQLVREARLRVRVLDPAGKVVPEVVVRLVFHGAKSRSNTSYWWLPQEEKGLDLAVPAGEVEVHVSAEGFDEADAGTWTTEPGKTVEGGTVSLVRSKE